MRCHVKLPKSIIVVQWIMLRGVTDFALGILLKLESIVAAAVLVLFLISES